MSTALLLCQIRKRLLMLQVGLRTQCFCQSIRYLLPRTNMDQLTSPLLDWFPEKVIPNVNVLHPTSVKMGLFDANVLTLRYLARSSSAFRESQALQTREASSKQNILRGVKERHTLRSR